MYSDLSKGYGGGLQFGPTNDLLTVSSTLYSQQRVEHLLLSGAVITDENGVVVRTANDLFAQDRGAGLARDVDGISDALSQADREARIKTALTTEPTVDQTQPVTVYFFSDPQTGVEMVIIQYVTIEGVPVSTGFSQ
jgi:hypothetical protein